MSRENTIRERSGSGSAAKRNRRGRTQLRFRDAQESPAYPLDQKALAEAGDSVSFESVTSD